eukprot:9072916-Alexandrium_andersonii.AAC.1
MDPSLALRGGPVLGFSAQGFGLRQAPPRGSQVVVSWTAVQEHGVPLSVARGRCQARIGLSGVASTPRRGSQT